MNLPNKLTLIRFISAPIFMALLVIDFPHHYLVAVLVFIISSITDYFDGKIARRDNLITDFGKFLDPIADKMITTSAYLGFLFLNIGYGIVWITFVVLLREFVVASVRLVAVDNGKVVAANFWGKLKTVFQMIAIIATLIFYYAIDLAFLPQIFETILVVTSDILLWISAILTFIAGITYIVDNKAYINFNK